MTSAPPASGNRFSIIRAASAALLFALLLPACGGDESKNRIKPIQATLSVDPFPGIPSQAVYFFKDPKDPRFPDLETVQVKLYTTTPVGFDAYNLEIHFDPTVVQIGDVFEYNPGVLGDCNSGTTCEPFCFTNAGLANSTGTFLLGVAAKPDCPTASISSDTMLLKIGFIAQSTIDPPGSRIELVQGLGTGDCEILMELVDQGIMCVDGNATMTASR